MKASPPFSCILIGDRALPILCGNLLLAHSHTIQAVVSEDPDVVKWAKAQNLRVLSLRGDLIRTLSGISFDYLFSIFNVHMLPLDLLSLPRKRAINFHDSLLPRNAGLFAPSWAIIQEEVMHGITWHIMEEKPDTGNILYQCPIPIEPEDTAQTLQYKCIQQGVVSFETLIADLAEDRNLGHPQDLTKRTVFTKYQKPSFGCVLSWNWSAEKIHAFIRGLTFGPSENPMGIGKFRIGDEFCIIGSSHVLDVSSSKPAGTLVSLGETLIVSTATNDVSIGDLLTVSGHPLSVPQLIDTHHLTVGSILPGGGGSIPEQLTSFHGRIQRHEAFWVQRLSQTPSLTLFSNSNQRDLPNSWEVIPIQVSEEELQKVKACSSPPSLNSTALFSAHMAFFSTLSSSEHFSVGYRDPGLQHILSGVEGLFATEVPLCVKGDEVSSLNDWHETVRREMETVHSRGSFLRDVWARYPALRALSAAGKPTEFSIVMELTDSFPAKHPPNVFRREGLTICISDSPFDCRWIYNPSLVAPETILAMATTFSHFLPEILKDPSSTVPMTPLIQDSADPVVSLPDSFGHIIEDQPSLRSVLNLFYEQVETRAESIAVVSEHEQISFRALNIRANQLANHLLSVGVHPEINVGIFLDRSIEMVIGILAILKTGGVYVPLDTSLPPERLNFILRDSQIQVLITNSDHLPKVPPGSFCTINLDTEQTTLGKHYPENPKGMPHPHQAAYMIYTSGSSGTPKGVIVQHASLNNFVKWAQNAYHISHQDKMLQFSSWSFDTSLEELFPTLCSGGTLVLRPEGMLTSISIFLDQCKRWEITVLDLPTAFWHVLISELTGHLHTLPRSLQKVIIGGEKAEEKFIRSWRKLIGTSVKLLNGYGPTEATVVSTFQDLTSLGEQELTEPGLIGTGIDNVQTHVLDDSYNPIPPNSSGELFIGGIGLARGYHNQPALTSEKFTPNPFSLDPGARLYGSGDIVQLLANGLLAFRNRKDHQVKIRGFRIELREIESVLLTHPLIKDGVVVVQKPLNEEAKLVAYLTKNSSQGNMSEDDMVAKLQGVVQKQLPPYMIPELFVFLETLPVNSNGKIDRRRLSQPDELAPIPTLSTASLSTSNERLVSQLWKEVLGKPNAGLDDHFLDLGGHSLKVFQLFSRLAGHGYHEISMVEFFKNPTLRGLTKILEDEHQPSKGTDTTFSFPLTRPDFPPLSYSQEQIWFLNELRPGNTAYNSTFCVRFIGNLRLDILEKSLSEIICRHESLRTTFHSKGGNPFQSIHEPYAVRISVEDFRTLSKHEQQDAIDKHIFHQSRTSFSLNTLPLIRWTCLQLADQEFLLIQVEHHFVHDGWSLSVLLKELQSIYEAFSENRPSPLSPLKMQFADFAVWQRQQQESDRYRLSLEFWQKKLGGTIPNLELPYDYPRPKEKTYEGAQVRTTLSPEESEGLRQLAQREGVTLYVVMLAAFYCVLHRYSGQVDIWIGTGMANRPHPDIEKLIGMIINTSVLRGNLQGNPTFRDFLLRVRDLTHEAFLHQDVPFDKLVEVLKPIRVPGKNPLFQVLFGFHDNPVPDLRFSDLLGRVEYPHNRTSKFDLNVIILPRAEQCLGLTENQVWESDKTISIYWEYSRDIFSPETATRMMEHYGHLLKSVVREAHRPITQLPMFLVNEEQQLLQEGKGSTCAYPRDSALSTLFEEQVAVRPDALAVAEGEDQLTFRQLDTRANQLARYLRRHGIEPGGRVGVCLERGIDYVVSVLAILKAGGAYVPVDPTAPAERVAFLAHDAAVELLVTQESHHAVWERLKKVPIIALDRDWPQIILESATPLPGVHTSAALAYVMYTSGSTGQPKGTLISHRSVVRLVKGTTYARLDEDQRVLQLAPLAFDASTFELWGSLLNGARLVIAPPGLLALEDLGQCLEADQISALWLTAGLFHQMVEHQGARLSRVEQVLAGGDVLLPEAVTTLLGYPGGGRVINGYGPTENTTFTCCQVLPAGTQLERTVPIGQPISNTQVYVVDPWLQLVPKGVTGELLVGGDGLAWGYLNQPGLTAEKFLPHPYAQENGARVYRTGDQVRWNGQGALEFLGRRDGQVKIRGHRVELGEIEAVLQHHPAVKQAVVVCREDESHEMRLVAYVVWADDQSGDSLELYQFLKKQVPLYMIPSVFVPLDYLPLSPNGKVDRQALPVVEQRLSQEFIAPESDTEKTIADMWCELLRLERVGIHDNFFHLGGHSLKGTQLISRMRDTFKLELPVGCVFEYPTVAELSKYVEATRFALEGPVECQVGLTDREEGEI